MTDKLYRHFLTILITLVLVFVFWGGYVAGSHGWPVLWLVFIPIYVFVYNRFAT